MCCVYEKGLSTLLLFRRFIHVNHLQHFRTEINTHTHTQDVQKQPKKELRKFLFGSLNPTFGLGLTV